MRLLPILALVPLAVGFLLPAPAQERDGEREFRRLLGQRDKDLDGKLSESEL